MFGNIILFCQNYIVGKKQEIVRKYYIVLSKLHPGKTLEIFKKKFD